MSLWTTTSNLPTYKLQHYKLNDLEFITFTARFILDSTSCHYQTIFNDFVVSEGFQLTIQVEKRYLRHTLIWLLTDFNRFCALVLICVENPCSQRCVVVKGGSMGV